MPILHVRNVPEELYEDLRRKASDEGRTLSAEVIALLTVAIHRPRTIDQEVAERINQRRLELARLRGTLPDSVDLIREDRDR